MGLISESYWLFQIKLDKTLEEATETGVLRLNGRKLKEISLKLQSLPKYDITDTIVTGEFAGFFDTWSKNSCRALTFGVADLEAIRIRDK